MADVLQVAKERRDSLATEIIRLDDFIRMAKALLDSRQGSDCLEYDLVAEVLVPSKSASVPIGLENAGIEEPEASHHPETTRDPDTRADSDVDAEAPRLPLGHRIDDDGSTHQVVEATVNGAMNGTRERHDIRSTFGDYIGVLRDQVQRSFRRPNNARAVAPFHGVAASSDLGATNATRAGPRIEARDNETASHASSHPSAIESLREQEDLADRPMGETEPAQTVGNSMLRLVHSIEQLRERAKEKALPVDVHLGQKFRQRRWMLGMTQQQLGDLVGVEVEQVKRYEIGAEYINATLLWEIARALHVPVAFFFEDLDDQAEEPSEARGEMLSAEETQELLDGVSQDTFIYVSSQSA
jgi:transcriptional regulator with XRE-family HTH domain